MRIGYDDTTFLCKNRAVKILTCILSFRRIADALLPPDV